MSYCTNCGAQEIEGQQFCPVCGAQKRGTFSPSAMPPLSYDAVGTAAEVRIGLSLEPPRHSRWTVLLRALLALPLFVVAEIVGIGALAVTIVAWFAALFTGRVPDGMQRFLTNSLRLFANLLAYYYLLIPRWPGVNFHSRPTEQVTVDVDHVRLRRWAVFFRILLGYPANLVSVLFTLGAFPVLFVMWCWGVVAGREPRSFHQALALVLRYQLRLQAYGCLLTPTQPFRGIFGDGPARLTPAVTPSDAPIGIDATVGGGDHEQRLATRWFVTKATRVVLVVILVVGAPIYALNFYFERPLLNRFQAVVARVIVTSSHTTTVNAITQFEASVARCSPVGYSGCVARAATSARDQLASAVATMSDNALVPNNDLSRLRAYQGDFHSLERELTTVQFSTSATTQRAVITHQLPVTFDDFRASYQRLLRTLHF